MTKQHDETSKFLSYILRHKPEAIGLTLDSDGWANIHELISCAANHNTFLTKQLIQNIVETSDKKRFTISSDSSKIRAAQGHSSKQVNIIYQEQVPPEYLYHGTATRFIKSIRENGLIAGSRHYVHLSQDQQTALAVGKRHGQPLVLKINTSEMYQLGFKFFLAENNVWLTEHIPMAFIIE